MKRAWILASAVCGAMAMSVPTVRGQAAPGPEKAPTPIAGLGFSEAGGGVEALGPQFTSQAAGISLRPPAGSKTLRRAGGDVVVEFINEDKKVLLRVTRTVLTKPMKLTVPPAQKKPDDDDAQPERGMLDYSTDLLLSKLPNNKVLRKDVIPLAGHDAGIVILRANVGVQDQFLQQAVIQSNEQLYYTIYMSSPGQPAAVEEKPNPAEVEAATMFRTVIDSVDILDQEKLRAEQDERLFKTRSLFLGWTEAKLRSVLVPEQWMRILKDGKDVGYSYMVEQTETRGTNPGLKIGIRSRMVGVGSVNQIDAETWYHAAFDRRSESWSSQSFFQEAKEKFLVSEYGTTSQRRKPVPDRNALGEGVDPRNPGVKLIDTYTINVHRKNRNVTSAPIDRDLPPYYIPQAMGHLLPRLVPLERPAQYLFASWIANESEVKLRYLDIGEQKDVTFAGQKLRVIPVIDKIGYDGAPTIHYMTIAGKYLGSESISVDSAGTRTVVAVIPTDAATLTGLWKGADLSAPEEKTPETPSGKK